MTVATTVAVKPAEKKLNPWEILSQRKSVCTCVAFNIERRMCRKHVSATLAQVCVFVCIHVCVCSKTSWESENYKQKTWRFAANWVSYYILSKSNGCEWHLNEFFAFDSKFWIVFMVSNKITKCMLNFQQKIILFFRKFYVKPFWIIIVSWGESVRGNTTALFPWYLI